MGTVVVGVGESAFATSDGDGEGDGVSAAAAEATMPPDQEALGTMFVVTKEARLEKEVKMLEGSLLAIDANAAPVWRVDMNGALERFSWF